uniref:Uncharacterized protein n=1 Tax=Kalanchoe fedtschenkoi TaxID=63787 RepID=A0A7N0UQN2_KALFE
MQEKIRKAFVGTIGGGIATCSQLRLLNLSGNQFNGSIPALSSGPIPSTLGDACGSFSELDISGDTFSGTVLASLGSCSRLSYFNVSSNNLTGKLKKIARLVQSIYRDPIGLFA